MDAALAPTGEGPGFALSFPPQAEFVATARMVVASIVRRLGCEHDRIEDVKVAVSEAVTNAIKAHGEAGVAEPVRVTARASGDGVVIEVIDRGPGFDASPSRAPSDEPTPPMGLYPGSLGLAVIRSLFPDVEVVRNGGASGMTVRFTVRPPNLRAV